MGPYGIPGSPTYSQPVLDIGLMLTRLPDNTNNQIDAKDVRDVVSGLFDLIQIQSATISAIGSVSNTYTNLNPSTVLVGGLSTQSSFNNLTFAQIFDLMFYPYTPPIFSFEALPPVLEFGNTSATITFSWEINATKNLVINSFFSRPLQASQNVSPPPSIFSSSFGFLSGNQTIPNLPTTFTFSVNDIDVSVIPNTGAIHETAITVSWNLARFWGTLPNSSPLVSVSSTTFSFSDISTLNYDLLSGYTQSRNITTNNDYVIFVWPSTNVVDLSAFPPVMRINGMNNTDWTKTRDSVEFTNQWGYTASYDVWRFNNLQPSYTLEYLLV